MKEILKVLFLFVFLISTLLPQTKVIYADANNGSDTNTGTIDNPAKSIQKAPALAGGNNSKIYLRAVKNILGDIIWTTYTK